MPRTKYQRKASTRKDTLRNSAFPSNYNVERISLVASLASGTGDQTYIITSTPKKSSKSGKMLLKQIKEDSKTFGKMLEDLIGQQSDNYPLFKLSIPSSVLRRPFKFSENYRHHFCLEEINDADVDEINENVPPKNVVQELAENFKKPKVPARSSQRTSKRRKISKLHTPNNPIPCTPICTITPKVNMNRPLSVLRHARIGEQAVSMSGSPLMVSSVPREDIPTVSVPLHDGRVVTILPTSEFQRDEMPSLDSETKGQLETLYRNLAVFFDGSEMDSDTN